MKRLLLAGLIGILLAPVAAMAQDRSHTEGFFANAHVGGVAGNVEDGDTEVGLGGGLMLGYGVNAQWQIFLAGDAMSLDISNPSIEGGYTLYQGDLGARLVFPDPDRAFVAYLVGALTGQLASGSVVGPENTGADVELAGFGGTVGTGFHYFLSPALALDTVVQFSFGSFTHADVKGIAQPGRLQDDLQSVITRLNVGLTWYPYAPH